MKNIKSGSTFNPFSELDISYSNDVTAEGLRGLYSVENQIRNREEKTVKSLQTEGSSTLDGRPRPEVEMKLTDKICRMITEQFCPFMRRVLESLLTKLSRKMTDKTIFVD